MFGFAFYAEFLITGTIILSAVNANDSSANQATQYYTLENDYARLVFDDLGRLTDMYNKKTQTQYINTNSYPLPIYIIDTYSAKQYIYIDDPLLKEGGGFCSADPKLLFSTERSGDLYRLAIQSSNPPKVNLNVDDGKQALTFSNTLEGDIRVTFTVTLPNDSSISEWQITVNNVADIEPGHHLRVYRVLFPLLSNLCVAGKPDKNYLARPYIQGELIPNPSQYSFTRPNRPEGRINVLTYPGWASMPWMDLYASQYNTYFS